MAEKLGKDWSRSKVKQHVAVLNKIATTTFEIAKHHQDGRVAQDATSVANFTERWFRDSGLYDLDRDDGRYSRMGGRLFYVKYWRGAIPRRL